MINLALSLGIGLAFFVLGGVLAGWLAGIVPAVLAASIAYFLLARRSGRQFEAIAARAGKHFEQGKVDLGRKVLEEAFALGRWQFLIAPQVHAQLGALDYMQAVTNVQFRGQKASTAFKDARAHLEKAWSRHWMAMAMLAALDSREGKHDAALQRMEKTTGPGAKDPVFWGLYAWMALQAGKDDRAIEVLTRGLEKNEGSQALKDIDHAVRNKKKADKRFRAFAPTWYQFYPEHMPREMMTQQAGGRRGGYSYPQPRR